MFSCPQLGKQFLDHFWELGISLQRSLLPKTFQKGWGLGETLANAGEIAMASGRQVGDFFFPCLLAHSFFQISWVAPGTWRGHLQQNLFPQAFQKCWGLASTLAIAGSSVVGFMAPAANFFLAPSCPKLFANFFQHLGANCWRLARPASNIFGTTIFQTAFLGILRDAFAQARF